MGYRVDNELIAELASPGRDQRHGVNIVARPPAELREKIFGLQNHLITTEPHQYYYPPDDLHLTFLEICSDISSDEAQRVFEKARQKLPALFKTIPGLALTRADVRFHPNAGTISFQETGRLAEIRELLRERLRQAGVEPAPRYKEESAHITFMRYLTGVSVDPAVTVKGFDFHADWNITELWLTCGPNWYGMRSRIQETAPVKLLEGK